MTDADKKMALWIAFTLREFTDDEIGELCVAVQTMPTELKKSIRSDD